MPQLHPDWWRYSQNIWNELINVFELLCPVNLGALASYKNWNKITTGQSNHSYQLLLGEKKYFVQISRFEQQLKLPGQCFFPVYEIVSQQKSLHQWLVTCHYESPQLRVFDWVETSCQSEHWINHLNWQKTLCEFMRQLHTCEITGIPSIDISQHLENYYDLALKKAPSSQAKIISFYQRALECSQYFIAETCCHNDLSPNNILWSKSLKIIDWEYVSMSDPVFELAGVSCNFKLTFAEENQLIQNYSEKLKVNINLKKFNKMKELYQLLTLLWEV